MRQWHIEAEQKDRGVKLAPGLGVALEGRLETTGASPKDARNMLNLLNSRVRER